MNGFYKEGDIVLSNWTLTKRLGEGSYGTVFEAQREDFGTTYKAAVKIITIPKSQSEVADARSEGMDDATVTAYFRSFVEELVQEFRLMAELKGNSNIVSYEDHQVIPHTQGIGWDILIRMEVLTPMMSYFQKSDVSESDIVRLGTDMCDALALCEKKNIIHRDIKPGNIFISELGNYKLGDFGIARTVEKTTGALSKKGTYDYMAPEVYNGNPYDHRADICSLGIVLYRLLNENRLPFLPPYPAPITHEDRETALVRRFGGEQLPPPKCASPALAQVVLKACAFQPQARYSTPEEFRADLLASCGSAVPTPPPSPTPPTDGNANFTPDVKGPTPPPRSPRKHFPLWGVVLAAILVIAIGLAFAFSRKEDPHGPKETSAAEKAAEPSSTASDKSSPEESEAPATVSAPDDAPGDDFTFGNGVSYALKNGELYISGNGGVPDNPDWQVPSENVSVLQFDTGITSIGACAFENFKNVYEVRLQNSVEKIGARAFASCESLSYIRIPPSVNAIDKTAFEGTSVRVDCEPNSFAETFCRSNGIPYTLNGKVPAAATEPAAPETEKPRTAKPPKAETQAPAVAVPAETEAPVTTDPGRVNNPDGSYILYTYSSSGVCLKEEYHYPSGKTQKVLENDSNGKRTKEAYYDEKGNLTKSINLPNKYGVEYLSDHKVEYNFDNAGRRTKEHYYAALPTGGYSEYQYEYREWNGEHTQYTRITYTTPNENGDCKKHVYLCAADGTVLKDYGITSHHFN